MARARPDTPQDQFSGPEIEVGCGLPKRAIEVLKRENLMPAPLRDSGRGSNALWSYEAMAEVAVIGAIFGAAPSLVLAARLGSAIYRECVAGPGRGQVPSRLDRYRAGARVRRPKEDGSDGGWDDVSVHARFRQHPDIYSPGKSHGDDLHYYVVDRRYVFSGSVRNIPISSPFGGRALPVAWEFVINGWQRGGADDGVSVDSFETLIPADWHSDDAAMDRARAVEEVAKAAWEDAVSTIGINVSLAIRRSLDLIYDLRSGKRNTTKSQGP